jgi:hypothetical protein
LRAPSEQGRGGRAMAAATERRIKHCLSTPRAPPRARAAAGGRNLRGGAAARRHGRREGRSRRLAGSGREPATSTTDQRRHPPQELHVARAHQPQGGRPSHHQRAAHARPSAAARLLVSSGRRGPSPLCRALLDGAGAREKRRRLGQRRASARASSFAPAPAGREEGLGSRSALRVAVLHASPASPPGGPPPAAPARPRSPPLHACSWARVVFICIPWHI